MSGRGLCAGSAGERDVVVLCGRWIRSDQLRGGGGEGGVC